MYPYSQRILDLLSCLLSIMQCMFAAMARRPERLITSEMQENIQLYLYSEHHMTEVKSSLSIILKAKLLFWGPVHLQNQGACSA